jgi:group I intron endonuclease
MPDYSNGTIYKIVNIANNNECVYVGSTCKLLCRRISDHRYNAKIKTCPIYLEMNEHGIENFKIVLVESYPCSNKQELTAREQHWIEQLKPKCNKQRAVADPEYDKKWNKEYYQKNKEYENERCRQYREKNREYLNARKKEKIQCQCGSIVSRDYLAKHRKTKKHQEYLTSLVEIEFID